jgi:hypothetical protein
VKSVDVRITPCATGCVAFAHAALKVTRELGSAVASKVVLPVLFGAGTEIFFAAWLAKHHWVVAHALVVVKHLGGRGRHNIRRDNLFKAINFIVQLKFDQELPNTSRVTPLTATEPVSDFHVLVLGFLVTLVKSDVRPGLDSTSYVYYVFMASFFLARVTGKHLLPVLPDLGDPVPAPVAW